MIHHDDRTPTDLLIDSLAAESYAVLPDFFALDLIRALRLESDLRLERGEFRPARIGQGAALSSAPDIRSDVISWIEPKSLSAAERELFSQLELLRVRLNRALFLGLRDFEMHYARYAPGQKYQRHLDRFKSDGARTVSVVIYLNENWSEADGGILRLYPRDGAPVDAAPIAGTVVMFLSEEIEHEVLASQTRDRLSLAAWFRR